MEATTAECSIVSELSITDREVFIASKLKEWKYRIRGKSSSSSSSLSSSSATSTSSTSSTSDAIYPHEITEVFETCILNPLIGRIRSNIENQKVDERSLFSVSLQSSIQMMLRQTPLSCISDKPIEIASTEANYSTYPDFVLSDLVSPPECKSRHKCEISNGTSNPLYMCGWTCDKCPKKGGAKVERWHCPSCRYDVCFSCHGTSKRYFRHECLSKHECIISAVTQRFSSNWSCTNCATFSPPSEVHWNCTSCPYYRVCFVCHPPHESRQSLLYNKFKDIALKSYEVKDSCKVAVVNTVMPEDQKLALIYNYVTQITKGLIENDILPSIIKYEGLEFLRRTVNCWGNLNLLSRVLNVFFREMVEFYVNIMKHKNTFKLDVLLMNCIRDDMFNRVKSSLCVQFLDLIDVLRIRAWDNIADFDHYLESSDLHAILKSASDLFIKVDCSRITYNECIADPYLCNLKDYYSAVVNSWLDFDICSKDPNDSTDDTKYFINNCISSLKLERSLARLCLHESSISQVDNNLIETLISANISKVESGLSYIFSGLVSFESFIANQNNGLASDRALEIARHSFFMLSEFDAMKGNTNFTNLIADVFSSQIQGIFKRLIDEYAIGSMDKDRDKLFKFYILFINLSLCVDKLIESTVFNYNLIVLTKMRDVHITMINQKDVFGKPFLESAALFADIILSKSRLKAHSTEQFDTEKFLAKIVEIFSFIDDKGTLFVCLQNHLFYRITENNYDINTEKSFLSTLSQRFGLSSVAKISSLLNCIDISSQLCTSYHESKCTTSSSDALVPIYPLMVHKEAVVNQRIIEIGDSPCALPFKAAFNSLAAHYKRLNESKSLSLSCVNGTCQINSIFPPSGLIKQKRIFNITTGVLQSYVLTAFNPSISGTYADENGYITFSTILSLTGIIAPNSDLEISKILNSLHRYNKLILQKLSKDVDEKAVPLNYSPLCKFKVNPDFNSQFKKFAIPLLRFEYSSSKSQVASKDSLRMMIDATIVRIMKTKKSLTSSELSIEVKSQLASRFTVTDRELHKRYELLIDNGHMRRDSDKNDIFIYLG